MSDIAKELTITEVKQKKRELDKAIAVLLNTFSGETGVSVDAIHIERAYVQQDIIPRYSIETDMKF